MEETKVVDETGTVPAMTRTEIEEKMLKELNEKAKPLLDQIKDDETRAKAEQAIKQLQAMGAMGIMWLNGVIADIAATTVYNFQQTYDWKGFMEYQAAHNAKVAEVIQAVNDTLTRIDHELLMVTQELKKYQPDHTKPPTVVVKKSLFGGKK